MCGYQFTLAHLLFIKRVMFQQKSISHQRGEDRVAVLACQQSVARLHTQRMQTGVVILYSIVHLPLSSGLLHKLNWICGCLMFVSLFFACLPFGEIVWAGQSSKTKPGSKCAVKPKLKLKEAKKLRTMLHNCEFSVSVSF